jgi:hypothetical protein
MQEKAKISKFYLDILNQVFEIEKKSSIIQESNSIQRNINKLKEIFEEIKSPLSDETVGLYYHNPLGEDYNENRTDCEASIAGTGTENLIISEVIKPIINCRYGGTNMIVQKGVVIVEESKI